jgi:hypothetical protein
MSQERKKLIKELDDAFSLYIRVKDKFKCITCGADNRTHTIQCGHLLSRVSHSTRWDELNAHAQCQPCNWYHEDHPERYMYEWLRKHGQKEYEKLYVKWNQTTKFAESDLRELIKYYKDKTKKLQESNEI